MKTVLQFLGGIFSAFSPIRRPYSGFGDLRRPVRDDDHPWRKEHALRREIGSVDGKYYLYYVDVIKQQKRLGMYDEAIELLLNILDAVEREATFFEEGVAPWYYEQLAIIYRKQKRFVDEVSVLERYAGQTKASGTGPARLAERLTKARALLEK